MRPFLLCLLCFFYINLFAQDSTQHHKSDIEQVQATTGTLLKKQYVLIEEFKSVKFEVLKVYDAKNVLLAKGLKISSIPGFYTTSVYSGFLDADELDAFIKFFQTIQATNETVQWYTEYTFTTRGDVAAFAYADKNKDWVCGMQLNQYRSGSYVSLKKKELDYLIKIFITAKENM